MGTGGLPTGPLATSRFPLHATAGPSLGAWCQPHVCPPGASLSWWMTTRLPAPGLFSLSSCKSLEGLKYKQKHVTVSLRRWNNGMSPRVKTKSFDCSSEPGMTQLPLTQSSPVC